MTLDTFSNRLGLSVEDYYCAKFQVILITSFRLIRLTQYTPSHIHTHTGRAKKVAPKEFFF